jgi:hypothetical protein
MPPYSITYNGIDSYADILAGASYSSGKLSREEKIEGLFARATGTYVSFDTSRLGVSRRGCYALEIRKTCTTSHTLHMPLVSPQYSQQTAYSSPSAWRIHKPVSGVEAFVRALRISPSASPLDLRKFRRLAVRSTLDLFS